MTLSKQPGSFRNRSIDRTVNVVEPVPSNSDYGSALNRRWTGLANHLGVALVSSAIAVAERQAPVGCLRFPPATRNQLRMSSLSLVAVITSGA